VGGGWFDPTTPVVYSPPLGEIGHYEVVDGELRRHAGRPDEVSPPSPGLSAALGVR